MSRRDPLVSIERLVLESVELLALVRQHLGKPTAHCLDVGSGAGFPGVIWALAEPDWSFVLVERKAGRAAFLRAESLRLALEHVEVIAESLDRMSPLDPGDGFDIAVAMAVAPPANLGPDVEHLLRPDGLFASTAPISSQAQIRVGKSLDLAGQTAGEYGNFVFYRRGGNH